MNPDGLVGGEKWGPMGDFIFPLKPNFKLKF